jgi:hypothetical protein
VGRALGRPYEGDAVAFEAIVHLVSVALAGGFRGRQEPPAGAGEGATVLTGEDRRRPPVPVDAKDPDFEEF